MFGYFTCHGLAIRLNESPKPCLQVSMMPPRAPNWRVCAHFSCRLGVVQNQGELWGTLMLCWPTDSTLNLLSGLPCSLASKFNRPEHFRNILPPLSVVRTESPLSLPPVSVEQPVVIYMTLDPQHSKVAWSGQLPVRGLSIQPHNHVCPLTNHLHQLPSTFCCLVS